MSKNNLNSSNSQGKSSKDPQVSPIKSVTKPSKIPTRVANHSMPNSSQQSPINNHSKPIAIRGVRTDSKDK